MAKNWYVLHTYSGYEMKVKANLEHRLETMGMAEKVGKILIPTEEVAEIKELSHAILCECGHPKFFHIRERENATEKACSAIDYESGHCGCLKYVEQSAEEGMHKYDKTIYDNHIWLIKREKEEKDKAERIQQRKKNIEDVIKTTLDDICGIALIDKEKQEKIREKLNLLVDQAQTEQKQIMIDEGYVDY